MSFELSYNAQVQRERLQIEPQLVLDIEDVPTKFGIVDIRKIIRVGDPDLYIDDSWVIGGFAILGDQEVNISLDGTTTNISQQLYPDKGSGTSVTSLDITLVDFAERMTELISPSFVVPDVLGRSATVWLGFANSAFPDDYFRLHRGIIDTINSGAGRVTLTIAHPSKKLDQAVFQKTTTQLDGAISDTSPSGWIQLNSVDGLLIPVLGPNGGYDSTFEAYIRVDDEVIRYTGIDVPNKRVTGVTRGSLVFSGATLAQAHDDDADVMSLYRLQGDAMTLALKFLLSGWGGPFDTTAATSFVSILPIDIVDNAIFFLGIDVADEFGITVGDYITTTGAINGSNNCTLKTIRSIEKTDQGSYIVVNGVSFVLEDSSTATVAFRSRYDTLPAGCRMTPFEVDVDQFEKIYRLFLSSFNYDFHLQDEVVGKDFLEKQLLLPAACYTLPRKNKVSAGYMIGPIPTDSTRTLDDLSIIRANKVQLKRTINRHFFNTIIYKMGMNDITGRFHEGVVATDATSKAQIKVGNKAQIIESEGMRRQNNSYTLAQTATTRRLNRYKFAAEHYEIETMFGKTFDLELGDIILIDNANLKISNTETGKRDAFIRFYEVQNKTMDIKDGTIKLTVVDTSFSTMARYCLISPASYIKTGISTTEFIIQASFDSRYGEDEYRKWDRYDDTKVRVRSPDGSVNATSFITSIVGNRITLASSLGFIPGAGYIMEFAHYDDQTTEVKLIYGFMHNGATFTDGEPQYFML